MSKDIMTSGIEMFDVIKTTGFPVPEDMEGKTFAECVSGSGGNVTLYAWKENSWSMQCYTYTDNPKAGDTVLAGAKGDLSSDIIFDVVESVEENIIKTHINDIISYSRYPDGDIVLQAGQGGSIVAEPLAVTENGVYTAPSGKAYSPVTVNVPSGGATDLIFNVKCTSLSNDYFIAVTFPRSNKVTDIAIYNPAFANTDHYSYNENGYIATEQASEANTKVSVVYDGDTYSYTYTGRDYKRHDLVKE